MERVNCYETQYILRTDLGDEATEQAIARYITLLQEQGATGVQILSQRRQRLAYPIKKYTEGLYVLLEYEAEGRVVALLERAMRLSEDVLRYLTVRQESRRPAETVAVD